MPDPPATQVEVENTEAATNNTTEANGVVMAEANVAPTVNMVSEANDAPVTNVQSEAHVNATAPVPPPRPHTIEQAFYQGEHVTVRWPILVPPPGLGPQFDYHVEHMPQVQKPKTEAAKVSRYCICTRIIQCQWLHCTQHLLS